MAMPDAEIPDPSADVQGRLELPHVQLPFEILIVEDSPTQALQLQHILEQHGYRAAIATNGREALACVRQRKPLMVISDVLMPEMNGYQLCRQIKADRHLKDIPVILLTSLAESKDVVKGLECGADNFIVKPYDAKVLLSRIEYILANRELRRDGNTELGVEIFFAGQQYSITSDRRQILDLLLSTYETAVQQNFALIAAGDALQRLNEHLEEKVAERTAALQAEIDERKRAEEALQKARDELDMRVQTRTAELAHANQELRTEIAERQRVEEALRQSETRLRAILDHVVDGILTIDERGIVESYNLAAERIFGYTSAEIIGQPVTMLVPDLHRDEHDSILRHALRPDSAERIDIGREMTGRRKDGATFPLELAVREMGLGDRRMFTAVARDITQRKEGERLKDELISTISHELRTPMTSLRGFAELMLKRDLTPEKQREFLTVIHNEALRLTALINDFLDLQRMEAGRQTYDFHSIEIAPLVRESVALFSEGDEKHTWRLEVPDGLPAVQADADRIRQVLSNLLSNAVKFSPYGGEVTVRVRQQGAHLEVQVADQGIGIPPEAVPNLFSKFFRVNNRDTRHIGGTGLGLALVKEIVEAHAGGVWVESTPGPGSTFFFTLPVAAQARQATPETVNAGTTDIGLIEDHQASTQRHATPGLPGTQAGGSCSIRSGAS
jgi:PAS domain S-box-containing protein